MSTYTYKTTPYLLYIIFHQVSPVLYALWSALVLYALNMPTYTLQYVLSVPVCTKREKIIRYIANSKHIFKTPAKYFWEGKILAHFRSNHSHIYSRMCTSRSSKEYPRPYNFQQLVHHKAPNKDPGGSCYWLMSHTIILRKWGNILKETVVEKERGQWWLNIAV